MKQPKDHSEEIIVRPCWAEVWMNVAKEISKKSYDSTLKVGAIVVSENNSQLLSLGYNGNYSGGPNERESQEPGKSGFIHAELNALIKLDFSFPKKKHMYITHSPCRDCSKLIVNAEISRVVYDIPYRDMSGVKILLDSGIEVFNLGGVILTAQ